MLTPGPSCVDPRVYRAMAAPIVGHMDPWFTEMMGDVQTLLRGVFQTQNRITFPISASGSGGIEAAVMNTLEAGDECIVCVNGAFSERMAIMAERIPRQGDSRRSALRPHGGSGGCSARGQGQKDQICRSDARRDLHLASCSASRITAKWPTNWARCSWSTRSRRSAAFRWMLTASASTSASAARRRRISAPPGMAPITVNARVGRNDARAQRAGAQLVFRSEARP